MKYRKPIFVITIPLSEFANDEVNIVSQLQKNIGKQLREDYYVIISISPIDKIEFNVFNNQDVDDINYEELEKLILKGHNH